MTRKVNSTLITARSREHEEVVTFARSIERLEAEGNSPEKLKEEAKSILGIKEDESIIVNAEDKLKETFKYNDTFRNLVNFKEGALSLGLLLDEQLKTLDDIENELAAKIANKYDLEVEDLYEEE